MERAEIVVATRVPKVIVAVEGRLKDQAWLYWVALVKVIGAAIALKTIPGEAGLRAVVIPVPVMPAVRRYSPGRRVREFVVRETTAGPAKVMLSGKGAVVVKPEPPVREEDVFGRRG